MNNLWRREICQAACRCAVAVGDVLLCFLHQDKMEASVGRRPGAPGRGQQDVPALALPVPSSPAHTGPVPVPKQPPPPPPPPTGSAPAASCPHPHGPAPALTASRLFSSAQRRISIIRMNFRGFLDEFLGLNAASAQEGALSSVRTNREV